MGHSTAADLPPELFPFILDYVRTDDEGWIGDREDWARDMMSCSLICLDWANRCRYYLFNDEKVTVKSSTELSIMESYARNGSTRLVPLPQLFRALKVEQTWQSSAWVWRVHAFNLHTGRRSTDEDKLVLRGPVPPHLSREAYRSPHWSLPRSLPTCYHPFKRVELRDIHFPCLSDLYALLRHFKYASTIVFLNMTWSKTDDVGSPVVFQLPRRSNEEGIVEVTAKGCTDNSLPCIQAFAHRGSASFSYMGEKELEAYVKLLRATLGVGDDGVKHVGGSAYLGRGDCECAVVPMPT